MPHEPSPIRFAASATAERTQRLALRTTDRPWSHPPSEHAAIGVHWEKAKVANPSFFNGIVYTVTALDVNAVETRGVLAPMEFQEFLYWRQNGMADVGICDAYGAAVLRSAEGHVMLCRPAANTLSAGKLTFVSGFIDRNDRLPDGRIDMLACTQRELGEEVGIGPDDASAEPGVIVARHAEKLMFAIVYRSRFDTASLKRRMLAFACSTADPEVVDVVAVADMADASNDRISAETAATLALVFAGDDGPVA